MALWGACRSVLIYRILTLDSARTGVRAYAQLHHAHVVDAYKFTSHIIIAAQQANRLVQRMSHQALIAVSRFAFKRCQQLLRQLSLTWVERHVHFKRARLSNAVGLNVLRAAHRENYENLCGASHGHRMGWLHLGAGEHANVRLDVDG